jgi:hypothetical protein
MDQLSGDEDEDGPCVVNGDDEDDGPCDGTRPVTCDLRFDRCRCASGQSSSELIAGEEASANVEQTNKQTNKRACEQW